MVLEKDKPMKNLRPFSENISYGQPEIFAGKVSQITLQLSPRVPLDLKSATRVLELAKNKEKFIIDHTLFRRAQKIVTEQVIALQKSAPGEVFTKAMADKITNYKKLLAVRNKVPSKAFITAVSSKTAKELLKKQGLKATAKIIGRIASKISGALLSPWLVPLIWSPEIIDIVTSKDMQEMWKNMQNEKWWRDAAQRDEIIRQETAEGISPKLFSTNNIIPYGEYYHRDSGWY